MKRYSIASLFTQCIEQLSTVLYMIFQDKAATGKIHGFISFPPSRIACSTKIIATVSVVLCFLFVFWSQTDQKEYSPNLDAQTHRFDRYVKISYKGMKYLIGLIARMSHDLLSRHSPQKAEATRGFLSLQNTSFWMQYTMKTLIVWRWFISIRVAPIIRIGSVGASGDSFWGRKHPRR
jgi:hypothetical protein